MFLDDLGRNLKPAQALGIKTIQVKNALTALRELEKIVGVQLVGEEEEEMLVNSLTGQTEGGRKVVMKTTHSSVKRLELRALHSKL